MFTPFADRVVVVVEKRPDKTPGGILLPDTVTESGDAVTGIVESVGPDVKSVAPGDRVAVTPGWTFKVKSLTSEDDFLVVKEEYVLGKYT